MGRGRGRVVRVGVQVMGTPVAERLTDGVVLYEGDCASVLRLFATGHVQAVLTDPPYSERTHKGHDSVSGSPAEDAGYDGANRKTLGYAAWTPDDVDLFVPELCRVASGWVGIMTDYTLAPSIIKNLESCGRYVFAPLPFYAPGSRCRLSGDGPSSWTDWIVVARTAKQRAWGTLPGGYVAEAGWRDREHMGGKPVKLMRALVRDYSRPGDTVLDPFAGSGTTAIAAMKEGRKCVLIEKDPRYCDVIRQRVAKADGLTPGTLFAGTPTLFGGSA